MNTRVHRVATAAAAIVLAAALPVAAQTGNPYHLKPGAKGKACLECHTGFEKTLAQPFVHTPVKAGECADCHNPHTSDHGKLLAASPETICSECHSDIVPKGASSVHQAVLEGGCVQCHDPHGSANKNNLVEAGNALCLTCHDDIGDAVKAAKFRHAPVEKSCLGCHDPHASTSAAFLLKKEVPGLCLGCHTADAAFTRQHQGYPVAKGDCTSCHDPHGSSRGALLWADVHKPVETRMCAQCHEDAGSSEPLKLKRAGADLCGGCHRDVVNEASTSNQVHWPVVDRRACLNCHNPHASKFGTLLAAPMKTLCGRCHADTIAREERSLAKHPPVQDGDCTTCHAPHAADNALLLVEANTIELCGTCHDWQMHSTHPIGAKVVDPRNPNLNLDCLSCHRNHGSEFKAFLNFDSKADLCVQCHQQYKR